MAERAAATVAVAKVVVRVAVARAAGWVVETAAAVTAAAVRVAAVRVVAAMAAVSMAAETMAALTDRRLLAAAMAVDWAVAAVVAINLHLRDCNQFVRASVKVHKVTNDPIWPLQWVTNGPGAGVDASS